MKGLEIELTFITPALYSTAEMMSSPGTEFVKRSVGSGARVVYTHLHAMNSMNEHEGWGLECASRCHIANQDDGLSGAGLDFDSC